MDGGNRSTHRRSFAVVAAGMVAAGLFAPGDLTQAKEQDAVIGSATSHSRVSLLMPDEDVVVVAERSTEPDACEPRQADAGTATATDAASSSDDAEGSAPWQPIASIEDYDSDLPDMDSAIANMPDPAASDSSNGGSDAEVPKEDGGYNLAEQSGIEAEASSFFGATPGLTTRQELLDSWGSPSDGEQESVTIIYVLQSFPHVAVGFAGDVVDTIEVQLAQPRETAELIDVLQLGRIRPTITRSAAGERLATVFPERGVALRHFDSELIAMAADAQPSKQSMPVYSLVVRDLRADDFIARAAKYPRHAYAERQADLHAAIEIDPNHAGARVLLSKLALETGRPALGERYAAEAVELSNESSESVLQWAKALTELAKYGEAVAQCRKVLDHDPLPPLVRAQTLHQMGVLAAFGADEVAKRSVPLHNRAIEVADGLAADEDPEIAVAAGELLVDAHLSVAAGITRGEWDQKDKYVAQWIGRASALAEHLIERDDQYLPERLKVAVAALNVGSRLQPPIDPQLWIAEAEETTTNLAPLAGDALARDQFNWQLGLAYYYAAEIQHRRGQATSALRYGTLAEAQLADLVEARAEQPDAAFLLGRLYFQIGAVHAVHREDHIEACQWYDKASQHLLSTQPVTKLAAPGPQGDALVSMGVSYWHTGKRDKAIDLTRQGLELAKKGVADGLLAESAPTVAQGNLNAMLKAVGETDPSTPTRPRAQVAGRPQRMIR